jgi:hypothetical protein
MCGKECKEKQKERLFRINVRAIIHLQAKNEPGTE